MEYVNRRIRKIIRESNNLSLHLSFDIQYYDKMQLTHKLYNRIWQSISFFSKQVVEFLFRHKPILIEVGSFNHLLKNIIILNFA